MTSFGSHEDWQGKPASNSLPLAHRRKAKAASGPPHSIVAARLLFGLQRPDDDGAVGIGKGEFFFGGVGLEFLVDGAKALYLLIFSVQCFQMCICE